MTREQVNNCLEALDYIERAEKLSQEILDKYPKKVDKELNFIAWSVISDWYSSYEPLAYHRQDDLFNVYRIISTTDFVEVSFSSEYFEHWHHQDPDIIYNNAFKAGYHGGSKSDQLDNNNIPQWREPIPFFTEWQKPAVQTFSPFYKMKELMEKKYKEIDNEQSQELKKVYRLLNRALGAIRR